MPICVLATEDWLFTHNALEDDQGEASIFVASYNTDNLAENKLCKLVGFCILLCFWESSVSF